MRWKRHARNSVKVLKNLADVQTRSERRSIPKIGGESLSTPSTSKLNSDVVGPGILYFLEHEKFNAFKIGISSAESRKDRVWEHLSEGWHKIEIWPTESVKLARTIEQTVINWWRSGLNAPPAVEANGMPQGGYTETVSRSAIGKDVVLEFIYGQFGDSLSRPAMKSKISELKVGMRVVVEGTVKVATLEIVYVGSYRGQSKYKGIYRYKVSDGTGELVVESYLSRARAKKIDAKHVKAPAEGGRVRIEGRVLSLADGGPSMGMIDPLVLGESVSPSLSDYPIFCGTCNRGKFTTYGKRYGRRYQSYVVRYLVCKKCKRAIKVADLF